MDAVGDVIVIIPAAVVTLLKLKYWPLVTVAGAGKVIVYAVPQLTV